VAAAVVLALLEVQIEKRKGLGTPLVVHIMENNPPHPKEDCDHIVYWLRHSEQVL